MADIGVLNLQITAEADQAVGSLSRLEGALVKVKQAVNESQIGKTASALRRINTAVTATTASNLNEVASALERVKNACDFAIPNLSGINKVKKAVDGIKNGISTNGMHGFAEGIQFGFETVSSRIETAGHSAERFAETMRSANQIVQQTAWSAGDMEKAFASAFDAWNKIRISMSLGSGQNTPLLGEGYGNVNETGWSYFNPFGDVNETGWTEWKNGAIEVEGTVTDAIDSVVEHMEDARNRLSEGNIPLRLGTGDVPLRLGAGEGIIDGEAVETVVAATKATSEFAGELENVRNVASGGWNNEAIEFARKWNESVPTQKPSSEAENFAWVDNLVNSASQIDLLNMKIESMRDRLLDGATSGKMTGEQIASMVSKIQDAEAEVAELTRQMEENASVSGRLRSAWEGLKDGIKGLFPTITGLIKRFAQIAKYRALRAVMKHITSGFTEGVENVYHYSKLVGTDLAPAMDAAATSFQQMKNSIGAAVAPVIQALVPVVQSLVNGFITLVNYVNQFFALLNGQKTWTRALPESAEAYEKTAKNAKKASKATKDLLADWDELNIIQSNSNSTNTGTTNQEYKNMFEEVSEFDQNVKDVISFIEEHLGGLQGLLKKLGLIILGWKFSKAFKNVLGDLGKLVAGGALLTLGVELNYGAAFEAGKKGYFDTSDILTTIGGTLATAIGGSLITSSMGFGSGIGIVLGIGVGIVATITGWIEGQQDFLDRVKWGDAEMTPDQIKKYIESKFTFNINSEISILDSNISNRETAEADLTNKINTFTQNLKLAKAKIGIKADDSYAGLMAAKKSADDMLDSVNTYIETSEHALTATLSISPMKDGQGNDITEDILGQVTFADKTLKEYFVGLGKELADAVYLGESNGWQEGEMEAVLDLMEHQRNIVAKAEEIQRDLTFEMNYRFNLNNLTRDNVKEISEQEKAIIEEYKQKFLADRETAKQSAIKELAWTEAAIEDYKSKNIDTTKLEEAKATYEALIAEYLSPEATEKALQDKLNESMELLKADWVAALTKTYGDIYDTFTLPSWIPFYRSPGETLAAQLVDAIKSDDPVKAAVEALNVYFEAHKKQQPQYIQDIMDTLGLSIWDISSDDFKQNLVNAMRQYLKNDDYVQQVLRMMQIPAEDVKKFLETNGIVEGGESAGATPVPVEVEPQLQTTKEEIQGQIDQLGDVTVGVKPQVEAAKETTKTNKPWWDIFGLVYQPPETETVGVGADVNVEVKNAKEVADDIQRQVQEAVDSNGTINTILDNYFTTSPGGPGVNTPEKSLQLMGVLGSAGMSSGVRYGSGASQTYVVPPEVIAEQEKSDNRVIDGVTDGVTTGVTDGVKKGFKEVTDDQNVLINQLINLATRIANKEWTINFSPTIDWGRNTSMSEAMWERVMG